MRILVLKRRAFTLLEVMIAIAILTVVVGAIYGTWRAIIGATRTGKMAAERVQQRRVALRCLEQSLTYATRYEASPDYYYFITPNDVDNLLSFVAQLPENFPRSGRYRYAPIRRVEFSLQPGEEGGNNLVLRQRPVVSEEFDIDEQEHPLVLMEHVKGLEMEYWDERQLDWTKEWTTSNQIPPRVRVTLELEDPNRNFQETEKIVREITPAAVGVRAEWQGRAPAQGGSPGGLQPPPIIRQ